MWPSFLATFSWILLFGYMIILSKSEVNYDEILYEENEKIRIERQKSIKAQWNLESNITDFNEELVVSLFLIF